MKHSPEPSKLLKPYKRYLPRTSPPQLVTDVEYNELAHILPRMYNACRISYNFEKMWTILNQENDRLTAFARRYNLIRFLPYLSSSKTNICNSQEDQSMHIHKGCCNSRSQWELFHIAKDVVKMLCGTKTPEGIWRNLKQVDRVNEVNQVNNQ